ncbi:MAG: phosphate acyltransferase PlsX [Kiritimatiellia bacterium]|nr:phosphate acyltransferase PlsX [Kiritimatiellia bacterium]
MDAMGGDHAPSEIVAGAVAAARAYPGIEQLILVGPEDRIRAEMGRMGVIPSSILIRHCSEVVGMEEAPAAAVRRKKDSSIGRAVDLVKAGEADAVFSAGNTGAAVAASLLKLRMLDGVNRPAIATVLPTLRRPFVLVDAGATPDCTPEILLQFGLMGSLYARKILGVESPLVGLLSVGSEESKGNVMTKETFSLFESSSLNFRGNVEGHDLFEGRADVVVCDGFVGNVVLKTSESVAHAMKSWMRDEFLKTWPRKLGALLLRGAVKVLKQRTDPDIYGGAPLLGVNGICIIGHGSARAWAVQNGIRVAMEAVEGRLNDLISEGIQGMAVQ